MQATTASGTARPKSPVQRISDEHYRHYRLIAGKRGDQFSAVAYAGRSVAFSASSGNLDDALDQLKARIDADFTDCHDQRDDAYPSAAEFERALALADRRLTDAHLHILETVRDGKGQIHPLQAQRRAGIDEEAFIREMGRLACLITDILDIGFPKNAAKITEALNVIAIDIAPPVNDAKQWTFRPQFAAAVAKHLAR